MSPGGVGGTLRLSELQWERPQEFDSGTSQGNLSDTPDQQGWCGMRTRFVWFEADARTRFSFSHDYHEEVYLLSGKQSARGVDDVDNVDVERSAKIRTCYAGTYFALPAGTRHDPFFNRNGRVLLEIHYYDGKEHRHDGVGKIQKPR
jgi:hypothetical protein